MLSDDRECDGVGAPGREVVLSERLDEDKLDQLRRWGAGLAGDENQELRATGKAIMLLIEEIEALHVELWNAKTAVATADEDDALEDDSQDGLDRTLGARLRRLSRGPTRRGQ
jgi:hypothetical protein